MKYANKMGVAGARFTRRQICTTGTAVVAAMSTTTALAQEADKAEADYLFVQTADSMAFAADRNRLTLHDVSPTTLFFSDRPERNARNPHEAVAIAKIHLVWRNHGLGWLDRNE